MPETIPEDPSAYQGVHHQAHRILSQDRPPKPKKQNKIKNKKLLFIMTLSKIQNTQVSTTYSSAIRYNHIIVLNYGPY